MESDSSESLGASSSVSALRAELDAYVEATLQKLKREAVRLRTFDDWSSTVVSAADLARAGFFRIFEQDRVQCAFCLGILGQWESGDDAMGEHRRCFAACPFVRGISCGNVPLGAEADLPPVDVPLSSSLTGGLYLPRNTEESSASEAAASSSEEDTSAEISSRHMTVLPGCNMSELGITRYSTPILFKYATQESRLATFRDWPEDKRPRPADLTAAGWFFTGDGQRDSTQCFHCGGSLHNWEPEDDPWVEHARWFPECRHVVLVQGQSFVDSVQRKIAQNEKPEVPKNEPTGDEGNEVPEDMLCKICINNRISLVFLPCSHLCACVNCASSLDKCPICRNPVKGYIRVFY